MKKLFLICMIYFPKFLMGQVWEFGFNYGYNSSDVTSKSRIKDWALENNAMTPRLGIVFKYHFNERIALQLELNKESRGWNSPQDVYLTSNALNYTATFVDYRYHYFMFPIAIDYKFTSSKRLYTTIGILPTIKTSGSKVIRANGLTYESELFVPELYNGRFEIGSIAGIGYSYPLTKSIHLYSELKLNYSFSLFEEKRAGHHYAYAGVLGLTYQLEK